MLSWTRDYNKLLLLAVFVLSAFSLAMIYSATNAVSYTAGYFTRHLGNLLVGVIVMLLLTILDYHAFEAWVLPLYIVTLGLLAIVLLLGLVSSGAQSWLNFGLRTFQPSEPAKLLVIFALAAYWSRFARESNTWRVLLGSLLLVGIPTLMVFLQPDFGTAMVFGAVWIAMAWTAGSRPIHLLAVFAAAIPVAIVGWTEVLQDYQRNRLLIFIDPVKYDPDLQNGAWNIIQSLSAITAGGAWGQGWLQGAISQSNTLPVQYSDFIFAVIGEELGFAGAGLLLMFLVLLLWQSIDVAAAAHDTFGRLIAVGIAAMFGCHILVNVGMNMSMMPITGIPLPFVSYGGSFTLTALAAVGVLQSIALRRRMIAF